MTLPWTEVALPMALALLVVFVPLLLACWLTRDPDRRALRSPPRHRLAALAAVAARRGQGWPAREDEHGDEHVDGHGDECGDGPAMARQWRFPLTAARSFHAIRRPPE